MVLTKCVIYSENTCLSIPRISLITPHKTLWNFREGNPIPSYKCPCESLFDRTKDRTLKRNSVFSSIIGSDTGSCCGATPECKPKFYGEARAPLALRSPQPSSRFTLSFPKESVLQTRRRMIKKNILRARRNANQDVSSKASRGLEFVL